jgi:hypothetical protein
VFISIQFLQRLFHEHDKERKSPVLNMDNLASTASVTTRSGLNEKASYSSTKTGKAKVAFKQGPATAATKKTHKVI